MNWLDPSTYCKIPVNINCPKIIGESSTLTLASGAMKGRKRDASHQRDFFSARHAVARCRGFSSRKGKRKKILMAPSVILFTVYQKASRRISKKGRSTFFHLACPMGFLRLSQAVARGNASYCMFCVLKCTRQST